MNYCHFCGKEIPSEAVFCPTCGKPLRPQNKLPWYFKTSFIVIAFLSVGPLALPLIWFHPKISRDKKIILSVVIGVLSYFLWIWFLKMWRQVSDSYKDVFQMLDGV